jgi:hypothetical protein
MKRRLSQDERMVVQSKYADIVNEGYPDQLSNIGYHGHTYHLWEIVYGDKQEAKSIADHMRRHGFGVYIHTVYRGEKKPDYYIFVRMKRK